MSEFFDVVFGLPTVVFTTLTLISLGFWILTVMLGLGEGGGDFDVDAGGDFDIDAGGAGADAGDLDVDAGGSAEGDGGDTSDTSGPLAGLLQSLNLHLLPLTLTITIVSLVGWLISAIGTVLLTSDNRPNVFVALLVGLAGLVAGVYVAGRVGKLLRPIFVPTRHIRRRDLIGRLCIVQTGRVDRVFGQAEVVDAEHSTHLIQIRCNIDNELRTGMKALIVDVDDEGRFLVSPDVQSLI